VHPSSWRRAPRELRKAQGHPRTSDVVLLQDELTADPHPDNMDVKRLRGRAPWLRARCGEHRILFDR